MFKALIVEVSFLIEHCRMHSFDVPFVVIKPDINLKYALLGMIFESGVPGLLTGQLQLQLAYGLRLLGYLPAQLILFLGVLVDELVLDPNFPGIL